MILHKKWACWLNSVTSSRHGLEVSCRRDRSIVLREIPGPLICVRAYAVAWSRALGCLTSFTSERTTEYREWKGKSTAAAVRRKHDPSKAVFSPLSGTDSPIVQRKESGTGEAWYCRTGTRASLPLPHGKSRKKVSSAALAECIWVRFHLQGACACACV